jgi:maltooligosyltrehalose trehalohydrolase
MKRRHEMPFGAECREDGSVRFRLWAPAAQQVDLSLESGSIRVPLSPTEAGWFEVTTGGAKAGSLYQFRINEGQEVPDPASRFQPRDVHGPSEVINAASFHWEDEGWCGRPWEEAVVYETHVGAFTKTGTFSAVEQKLDHLMQVGVTALELMPVSDFPGKRNWGYDGVLPFAPDSSYGRPDNLKSLIQAAHARRIMVLLDVVYNHFGPEGNYLGLYAPQFFTDRHKTPWGNGINFDGPLNRTVRDFFIHNALYWLTEYHFDGLRLDAVHAIVDDSKPDILTELATTVRNTVEPDRYVHLILENELNQASRLKRSSNCQPETYTAQWNDDIHHTLHVLTTGEHDGYYSDYSTRPLDQLGRCLVSGFAYQDDASLYKNGEKRGEPTNGLPLTAFLSFLQNHDQIGNRAFGERILTIADARAVRSAAAILLLAPAPPMLFMGEEFGARSPFLFFCDFEKDLAAAVTAGRRNEFARFIRFSNPDARRGIPDPNATSTFELSRLDWETLEQGDHPEWLDFYRQLLALRFQHVVPRLAGACRVTADYELKGNRGLACRWNFQDGSRLSLLANMSSEAITALTAPDDPIIFATQGVDESLLKQGTLPAWSVVWSLKA